MYIVPFRKVRSKLDEILTYITNKYDPLCILVYGSYAIETNNEFSDFDCMIITKAKTAFHDTSVVNGVQLDLFILSDIMIQR